MTVEGKTVFEQGKGLLVFVGLAAGDTERDADVLSAKIVKMRIFGDENGKMNRSVTDIGGDIARRSEFYASRIMQEREPPRFYGERASRTSRADV